MTLARQAGTIGTQLPSLPLMKSSLLAAFALGALITTPTISTFAAAAASDNAANYGTDYNGQNAGTGFGGFGLTTTGTTAGTFVGDSTQNGNFPSGGINTTGKAFGVYAAVGSSAVISRAFTAGGADGTTILGSGQTFSLSLDNGYVTTNGNVGFNLLNDGGTTRFSLSFTGGSADYFYYNGTASVDTGVSYTDGGLAVSFAQGAGNAFTLMLTPAGGTTTTINSTLAAVGDVSHFQVFSTNTGSGQNYDLYFNSVAVSVPEPTTLVTFTLGGLAGLAGLARRRHQ